MSSQADHPHSIRKVLLPSGKTIEVVSFEDTAAAAAPATAPATDLHRCAACDSSLVYPLDWEESGERHWQVTLRCPNCEWTASGVYSAESVERFDEELDRGTESLISDLRRLMRANMEADIDRFTRALHAGYVVPEDF